MEAPVSALGHFLRMITMAATSPAAFISDRGRSRQTTKAAIFAWS